jgi:NhaP-type Na+/H+ or K+/H+ antiporter
MELERAALTFAIALAAGMMAQVAARHLRVPGIVLLLLAGVLLGPDVANIVRPDSLNGGLRVITAAAVAVILFEGGMQLDISRLRAEGPTIRRLITLGALITAVLASAAAHLIMGWSWEVAIPFGTLVIVTGPTVIGPLLRRIRVNRNLHTILEAEGVLIDPIGAIIAVVALEMVLATELSSAAEGLLGIPMRLLFGVAMGAAGGYLMGRLLEAESLIPSELESITTLSLLIALHATSEALVHESGIMAAAIAGVVVGNMPLRRVKELRDFKEQLSVLLIGLLFVLLAADVRLSQVTALGWRGVATVAVLMLVVRPVVVAASTIGSGLSLRERAFVAWIGPRGIVAAAVASLFADQLVREGIDEGLQLRALVFLVIAATVVIQGISGGFVAGLLGVRRRYDAGFMIAGANPVARALGVALRHAGEEVVIVDTDSTQVRRAGELGLQAVSGSALDSAVLDRIDLDSRRGVITLIPNEGVSVLIAEKARHDYRVLENTVALRGGRADVAGERIERLGAHTLFGTLIDLGFWSRQISAGTALLTVCRYTGDDLAPAAFHGDSDDRAHRQLLIAWSRRGRAAPVDDHTRLRADDVVYMLTTSGTEPGPHFSREETIAVR